MYYFSLFMLSNCMVFLLVLIIYNLPCKAIPIVDIVLCWRPDCHLIRLSCGLHLFTGDARRGTSAQNPSNPSAVTCFSDITEPNEPFKYSSWAFFANSRARQAAGLPHRWCASPVSAGGVRTSRPSRSGPANADDAPPRMDFTIL